MKYIPVAAHRGNIDGYPENTLPAFRSAYEIGADMIELDLHMTKDKEIVVIHDDRLDRTTDITGRIRDLTLAEIKKADAGIKKNPKFACVRVPAFREFLELTRAMDGAGYTKMTFNFEFKDYFREGEDWAKESCDRTVALIEEYGLEDRCVVNSFDGKLLNYVQEKWNGRFRLHGFHPYSILGETYPMPMYCVCLFDEGKDSAGNPCQVGAKEIFDAVKADGCQTWLGAGVKLEEHVKMGCEYGADLFTSNEPAKLMEMLAKLGYREGEWTL
ncbi:MAG: hypothetical protein IJ480_11785 [Clostridia bacterium]|nr:hypothetical protein [Clostridia bacterium]